MRLSALLLLLACAPAWADSSDEDEDGAFSPYPNRSIGFGMLVRGSRIGGQSETGGGLYIDAALGRGRWQYFVEGSATATQRTDGRDYMIATVIGGKVIRGGLGARWIARQFKPDRDAGLELFLVGLLGAQRFYYDDGGRLTRPEIAFGPGFAVRKYSGRLFTVTLDARIVFTPSDEEGNAVACGRRCASDNAASAGFSTNIGVAW